MHRLPEAGKEAVGVGVAGVVDFDIGMTILCDIDKSAISNCFMKRALGSKYL